MLGWKPKSRDPKVASARYRCMIPLRELQARGFPVELFDTEKEDAYRGVIFSKCYDDSDRNLARRLRSRGDFVVLDLCDNHFYNPFGLPAYERARENLLEMIGLTDLLVCSTPTLADLILAEAGLSQRPLVVGDPVEFSEMPLSSREWWRGVVPRRWRRQSRLLWFGIHGSPNAPSGMGDVCCVADKLKLAAREHPFELVICSNSSAEYDRLIRPLGFQSSYVEYRSGAFPDLLAEMDGVILPVNKNPFTWAKSHNRLTTALFAGVPAVADGMPSYREFSAFCTLDDWSAGLREVLTEPRKARHKALEGREYIMKRWMPSHVSEQWSHILSPLVSEQSSKAVRQ